MRVEVCWSTSRFRLCFKVSARQPMRTLKSQRGEKVPSAPRHGEGLRCYHDDNRWNYLLAAEDQIPTWQRFQNQENASVSRTPTPHPPFSAQTLGHRYLRHLFRDLERRYRSIVRGSRAGSRRKMVRVDKNCLSSIE